MRSTLLARFSISLTVIAVGCMMVTPAFALSVNVTRIHSEDDVDDLRNEVEDELEDELEDLRDDCTWGSVELDDEEDDLIEDIQDIYDDARNHASINFHDELDDDEEDLIDDVEDEIDSLMTNCGNGATVSGRNTFGGNFFSPFAGFAGGFSGFNTGARVTTVTPLYNNSFSPSFGQSFNGGCQGSFSSPFWNSGSCSSSFGGNSFGSSYQW